MLPRQDTTPRYRRGRRARRPEEAVLGVGRLEGKRLEESHRLDGLALREEGAVEQLGERGAPLGVRRAQRAYHAAESLPHERWRPREAGIGRGG